VRLCKARHSGQSDRAALPHRVADRGHDCEDSSCEAYHRPDDHRYRGAVNSGLPDAIAEQGCDAGHQQGTGCNGVDDNVNPQRFSAAAGIPECGQCRQLTTALLTTLTTLATMLATTSADKSRTNRSSAHFGRS
jgi:hypothetical protein